MTGSPRLGQALIAAAGFLAGVVLVVVLQGVNHDHTRTVTRHVTGPTTTQTQTQTRTETKTETVTAPDQSNPDDAVTVPDVTGLRLDEAKRILGQAGLDNDIVEGGGAFGPVDDSSWVVVDQDPPGGSEASNGDTVDLSIERP